MEINCNIDDENDAEIAKDMEIAGDTEIAGSGVSIVEAETAENNADANTPQSLVARPSNQQHGRQAEFSPSMEAAIIRGRGRGPNRERNRGNAASRSEKLAEILDSTSSLPSEADASTPSTANTATAATPLMPPMTLSTGDLIEDEIDDSGQHAGDDMALPTTVTVQQNTLASRAPDAPSSNGRRPMQEMDSNSQKMSLRTPRSPGGREQQNQFDSIGDEDAIAASPNMNTNARGSISGQPSPSLLATKRPTDASAASAPPTLLSATSSGQPLPVPTAYRRHASTPEKQSMVVSPNSSSSPTDNTADSSFQPGAYEVHGRAFGNLPAWARRRISQRRERQRQQQSIGRSSSIVSSIRSRLSSRSSRSRTSSRVSSSSRRPSSSMLNDSAFSFGMIMPIRRLFSSASSSSHAEHAHEHGTRNSDNEGYVVVDPISGQILNNGGGENNETHNQHLVAIGEDDDSSVDREDEDQQRRKADVDRIRERVKVLIRGGVIILVLIAAMIALALIFRSKRDSPINPVQPQEEERTETTPSPPPLIATKIDYIREQLQLLNAKLDVTDNVSPQYQALEWLATHDEYFMYNETKDIAIETKRRMRQRFSVVVLFFATDGFNSWHRNLNFLSTKTSICDWHTESSDGDKNGIWCDGSDLVVRLYLDHAGLRGTLPSEISMLTTLKTLSLRYNNDIHGTLPEEYGEQLTRLSELHIVYTSTTGGIPKSFSKLSNLKSLHLSDNLLSGPIPSGLMEIEGLEQMDLSLNFLSGIIPSFSSGMDTLYNLSLRQNRLVGSIPPSIFSLTSLVHLSVGLNSLSGPIDSNIGALTVLTTLDFEVNSLSSNLPTEIGKLSSLVSLFGGANFVTGSIPTELSQLSILEVLDLRQNDFDGTIPSELSSLEQLAYVDLSKNFLTGILHNEFATMQSLEFLDVAFNQLSLDALQHFCDKTSSEVDVRSDCGGNSSSVDCPCCVACHDPESQALNVDFDALCHLDSGRESAVNEGDALQRGRTCSCVNDTSARTSLSCTETCKSCNTNGTTCAFADEFKRTYHKSGFRKSESITYRYEGGNDAIITFHNEQEFNDENLPLWECSVFVNDTKCRECIRVTCRDGFSAYAVLCDNVDGAGNYYPCDDENDTEGPLSVFALQNPRLLDSSGCLPTLSQILHSEEANLLPVSSTQH